MESICPSSPPISVLRPGTVDYRSTGIDVLADKLFSTEKIFSEKVVVLQLKPKAMKAILKIANCSNLSFSFYSLHPALLPDNSCSNNCFQFQTRLKFYSRPCRPRHGPSHRWLPGRLDRAHGWLCGDPRQVCCKIVLDCHVTLPAPLST